MRRAQKNPPKHLKDGGIMIAKGGEKPSGNDCHEAKVVTMAWVGGMGVGHLGGGCLWAWTWAGWGISLHGLQGYVDPRY